MVRSIPVCATSGMTRRDTLIGLAVTTLLVSSEADAHAVLKGASPPAGATIRTAPEAVTLTFNEKPEPSLTRIEVTDAQGTRVDRGTVTVVPGKAERVRVALQPLAPGEYVVRWVLTSVDTHRTEGSYRFKVAS